MTRMLKDGIHISVRRRGPALVDVLVISALAATNSQHVLGKILVRLLTMRTIQELKQGEYSVTSGALQNASALR